MNTEEFQILVLQEPFLAQPLQRSIAAVQVRSFSPGLGETAAIAAFMFPIVRFLLTQIGLPWLHEAARYSELWRLRFDRWIDTEYRKQGFDPDQAEAAGKSLRKELEQTTDPRARPVRASAAIWSLKTRTATTTCAWSRDRSWRRCWWRRTCRSWC